MKHSFKIVALAIIALFAGVAAYAQVTTSAIAGRITDTKGGVVPGAVVIAVHVPSGTTYHAVTGGEGRYAIQGMRPGGPYVVTVSLMGYEDAQVSDITLKLGETADVAPVMKEATLALEGAVVVAEGAFEASKTGAAQAITRRTIEEMPSISRGIADVTRINPFVRTDQNGGMSFAGASNKYNSFQIDGAMNNDVFGLTNNGANGGQAGTEPVSMETIDQIQVSIAPFDVRQSGFTGGSINAITKSGTNQFHGSVYGYGYNENLVGRYTKANGDKSDKYSDEKTYQAGVTISGPIIKNKLFFFASYERANKEYPNTYGLGSGASKVNAETAQKVYDYIVNQSKAQGYEYTGALPSDLQVYTKSDKVTAKLDWNINDRHHASFRYSLVSAKQLNSVSTAAYLDATDYSYDFVSKTNTFVGELQSRLANDLNNELRISYVRVRDQREPLGAKFPMFQISGVGDGTVCIGNERSSEANHLYQDIFSLTDNLTKTVGIHTITFGTHNELYRFSNLFLQDIYGTYYFNTPEDLYAGKINRYRYAHPNTNLPGVTESWEPTFKAAQLGFYAQDKMTITPNFDLTLGLRVDVPLFLDEPTENPDLTNLSNKYGWGLNTAKTIKGAPLFSPRLGFRWDIAGNRKYVLRGGAGMFTGRIPFVWFSNNYSNTGVQLTTYDVRSPHVDIIYDPSKQGQNEAKMAAGGSQVVNTVDPNFNLTQTLKFDLGFDFRALGIDWTVEGIFTKNLNDIMYTNPLLQKTGKTVGQDFPSLSYDSRPRFAKIPDAGKVGYIYNLTNTNKGYAYNVMVSANKHFNFGLDINASYTFTQSKSVFNGTSSVAQSNFNYNYHHSDVNDPELSWSAYNIPHQVKVAANYHKTYGRDHWTTTVGAVYIGTSGAAYSMYYNGDINNDGSNGNDLMFIPTEAQLDAAIFTPGTGSNAKYTADVQKANMKQWLANTDYLKDHRGEYFDRYAANMPFENHVDVHVGQKFSFKVGRQTHGIELIADIINFTNMLNPKWGRSYGMGINNYYSPVTVDAKNGNLQFLHDGDYDMFSFADYYSRWKVQVGVRYTF